MNEIRQAIRSLLHTPRFTVIALGTLALGIGDCWVCHIGPNFTDERFHNTGVA